VAIEERPSWEVSPLSSLSAVELLAPAPDRHDDPRGSFCTIGCFVARMEVFAGSLYFELTFPVMSLKRMAFRDFFLAFQRSYFCFWSVSACVIRELKDFNRLMLRMCTSLRNRASLEPGADRESSAPPELNDEAAATWGDAITLQIRGGEMPE